MTKKLMVVFVLFVFLLSSINIVTADDFASLEKIAEFEGVTYLNLPETVFGGPIVPATLKLENIKINGSKLDLAGSVSYNNQSYPLDLTGNLKQSKFGKSDKVGQFRDETDNFEIIHMGLHNDFNKAAINTKDYSLEGQNVFCIYILRKNTREFSIFELPLPVLDIDSDLRKINQKKIESAGFSDDYWQSKVFLPISTSKADVGIMATSDSDEDEYSETYTANPEGDTLTYHIKLKAYVNGPSDIANGSGDFNHQLTNYDKWTSSTAPYYESDTSPFVVGKYSDPIVFQALADGDSSTSGDAFLKGTFAGSYTKASSPGSITIGIGVSASLIQVSWSKTISFTKSCTETSNYYIFGDDLDTGEYAKKAEFTYKNRYLPNKGQNFQAILQVAWVGGSRNTQDLDARWICPIYADWDDGSSTLYYRDTLTLNTSPSYYSGK